MLESWCPSFTWIPRWFWQLLPQVRNISGTWALKSPWGLQIRKEAHSHSCRVSQHFLFHLLFALREVQWRIQITHKQGWNKVSELSGAFSKWGSLLTLYDPRAAMMTTLWGEGVWSIPPGPPAKINMGFKPGVPRPNFVKPSHLHLTPSLWWCWQPHDGRRQGDNEVTRVGGLIPPPAFSSLQNEAGRTEESGHWTIQFP